MKTIKALHLASFDGNIGDNANHNGFRRLLSRDLDISIEYTELEIREFYWGLQKFDEQFVEEANSHDLLIIGGGNYFELWVEKSATGTSIDIVPELFKKIQVPVFFNGLGCDTGKGVTPSTIEKFRTFLDIITSSDQYMVTVRNDGSLDTIKKYIGKEYADRIHNVPDGGFFTKVKTSWHPELPSGKTLIGISLAGDMQDIRFRQNGGDEMAITYETFVENFAELVNQVFATYDNIHVVFFPHIFRDFEIISDVIDGIQDRYRRKRVTVAPYLHGKGSEEYMFDLYKNCQLILGMRFHANVCGIGLNVPTIGLVNYPKIEALYGELGMPERCILVNKNGFTDTLRELIDSSLRKEKQIRVEYANIARRLNENILSFHKILNEWMNKKY